jgi:hypothetical protein
MSVFDSYVLEDCVVVDEHGIRWMKERLPERDFIRTRFKLRRSHPTAQEYLQQYPEEFPWSRFCLKYGKVSKAESYRTIRSRLECNGFLQDGLCYENSMHVLQQWKERRPEWVGNRSVSYVEGLALDPTGIFLHGWIDVGGVAYDVTFARAFMTTYFGVHFEPSFAYKTMEKIGKYGIFHWWERSQSILEKSFKKV